MDERNSLLESTIAEVTEPTPEGLAVKRTNLASGHVLLEEVGHFDYVVCEHRISPSWEDKESGFWIGGGRTESGVLFLAGRVADLNLRCETLERETPTSIDLPLWKRNRRAGRRRLRRWLSTHQPATLTLPREFRDVVRDVMETAPEKEFEFQMEMIEKKPRSDYGLRATEGRRNRLARDQDPRASERSSRRGLREAYLYGLPRATIVLCRAVLEEVIKDVLSHEHVRQKAMPLFSDRLEILINCLPNELLKPRVHQSPCDAAWIRNRGHRFAAVGAVLIVR